MTLYDINKSIQACIDAETGEVIDFGKLEELEIARSEKLENIALWIKNLNAEESAIKAEMNSFNDRANAVKRKAESLKKYLSKALEGRKFETPRCVVSFRKSTSVEVEPAFFAWAEQCGWADLFHLKDPLPKKATIKKLIEAGEEIIGAKIVEKESVQIK
jgi:Siphovirus Gp157.